MNGAAPGRADPVRPAVRLASVSKSFGSRRALDGARLEVAWGEVHALLGENGAGKSTLVSILAGFYAADAGTIEIDGARAEFATPRAATAAGIGMIHQHFKLVGALSVIENIRLACGRIRRWRSRGEAETAMAATASQIGFTVAPDARVDKLSISEQQKLEILKALLAGARILIMDEPTAVLAAAEAEATLALARRLADDGRAVILITHKLRDVTGYADRVTVMRSGRTVIDGAPTAGLAPGDLARAMIGAGGGGPPERRRPLPAGQRLALAGIDVPAGPQSVPLSGIGFEVRGGEILGIAGLGGNGQSELVELLIGLRAPAGGEIRIDGAPAPPDPATRRERGMRFIPADRFGMGLFGDLRLNENLALPRLARERPERRFWVSRRWMNRVAADAISEFEVAGAVPELPVRLLSGGNAQKLMVAREFGGPLSVLVAHSPARGLDIRAVAAIQARLLAAARQGVAVLLISEDVDEILELADRVAVMSHGRISPPLPIGEVDRATIGRLMLETA